MRRLLIFVLALSTASPLLAWGEKGHYLVAESATMALPNDIPPFFYKAFPQLIYLAFEPDRIKGGGKELDAANEPDHYLNFENTAGLELPRDRYAFVDLMIRSGRLRKLGITTNDTGFLPWRIAELAEWLEDEWRIWRRTTDPTDRAQVEHDIIVIAGVLGHFAGDSSNPHHTTWNFNGWVDPNPNGYATDCDVHARFEQTFISHAMTIGDIRVTAAPKLHGDYFAAAMSMIRESNGLVERLYQLDKAGAFDVFRKPPSPEGRAFAAARIAAGGALLRDLWWSAWRNSEGKRRR